MSPSPPSRGVLLQLNRSCRSLYKSLVQVVPCRGGLRLLRRRRSRRGLLAACWPLPQHPACLWVVPRYVPAWVAAGSIAATRNLMAAAASANCAVLVRHACDVPVRASLHVGYWAGGWADREDLFAHAMALRARADIEVCAADEDAASRQGSSTDGQARSWLARR